MILMLVKSKSLVCANNLKEFSLGPKSPNRSYDQFNLKIDFFLTIIFMYSNSRIGKKIHFEHFSLL